MIIHYFICIFIFYIPRVCLQNNFLRTHYGEKNKMKTTILFSPCTFPRNPASMSKSSNIIFDVDNEFNRLCHFNYQMPYICDTSALLNHHRDILTIRASLKKHQSFLQQNVKQLAQPISSSYITKRNSEFECLFQLPCQPMNSEAIEKYVNNIKTFTKIYTSAIFERWFSSNKDEECSKPRVMILVLVDGLMSDPRKLTTVYLSTDNRYFNPYISNIHLETTNLLLQGVPLAETLADLIDQLGFAFREFHNTGGKKPRHHIIPNWAWHLLFISTFLALFALFVEWLIVKKKISKKRPMGGGLPVDTGRKTHLIF